jgi:large subunit ribosomal protein L15
MITHAIPKKVVSTIDRERTGASVIMMIHEITEKVGRYKQRKRIGRGESSGWGKTSGRGHKGAGQRAGNSYRAYFEGGQMPFARRIPKRGFTNAAFRREYHIVNLKTLEERLENGDTVTVETLARSGIVRDAKLPLKVLGEGDLRKKLHVTAAKFSKSARAKIEAAGGDVNELPRTKWTRNGVVTIKPKAKPEPKPAAPSTKKKGEPKVESDSTESEA